MPQLSKISSAITILKDGGVGVLPTDTVYGLAACANNKYAVKRLYALKGRKHKPGTVVAANVQQLIELGVPERYLYHVEKWWPNPLSVIIPLDELEYLHQGVKGLACRVVADESFRKLLEQTGPLLTSSANRPGEPESVNIQQAQEYFDDQVDFYVDGGDLSGRAPSTVIGVSNGEVKVFREGAFKLPVAPAK